MYVCMYVCIAFVRVGDCACLRVCVCACVIVYTQFFLNYNIGGPGGFFQWTCLI